MEQYNEQDYLPFRGPVPDRRALPRDCCAALPLHRLRIRGPRMIDVSRILSASAYGFAAVLTLSFMVI